MTTTRQSSTTVTFVQPFRLDGFDQAEPAGSYTLDIEEELLDTLLTPVWKRVSTTLRVLRHGGVEHVPIDPEQLNEALARDRAPQSQLEALAPSPPEARRTRAYSFLGRTSPRTRR